MRSTIIFKGQQLKLGPLIQTEEVQEHLEVQGHLKVQEHLEVQELPHCIVVN